MNGPRFQLPENFNPAEHARMSHLADTNPADLSEGVNVLHHNAGNDTYVLAEKAGMTVRCWSCHKNKDGSIDCFVITCPWDPPPAPTKAE